MGEQGDTFRSLMSRLREGSEDAAWELVSQYGEPIRRAVRRALNERLRTKFDSLDFVQLVWNSFFRMRDKADRFDRPEELAAYLVKMAQNKVGMEVRRRLMTSKYNLRRERSLDQCGVTEYQDRSGHQPAPIDVLIARERWARMLEGQPSHYREIIRLRLRGLTHQNIANALGLDECTVRRFLKRLFKTVAV